LQLRTKRKVCQHFLKSGTHNFGISKLLNQVASSEKYFK
jgi:hypothetical protein